MKIKNILFIQPFTSKKEQISENILVWSIYLENYLKRKLPKLKFALLYLPSLIRKKETILKIVQNKNFLYREMDVLISRLRFNVDDKTLICLSGSTTSTFLFSKLILEYFQQQYPKSIVVFGGIHASACSNDFLYPKSPVDYIVKGEGEISLYKLIKEDIKKHDVPITITGIPLKNLDDLPSIDFSLFDPYIENYDLLGINLSRGCPFSCNFCLENQLSSFHPNVASWRPYSPKRAIKEVNNMINYGLEHNIKAFSFYDPIFGMRRKWLEDFFELYDQNHYSIFVEPKLDILNQSLLKKLIHGGFVNWYGLESYSKEMLLIMGKTNDPTKYLKNFREVCKIHKKEGGVFGINTIHNYPGEKKESLVETFDCLHKLARENLSNTILFNITKYNHFPGTYLYNNFTNFEKKYGAKVYFPKWWTDFNLIENGACFVRPSSSLSLRDGINLYTEEYVEFLELNFKMMKSIENNFPSTIMKGIQMRMGVKKLTERRERQFNQLDDMQIEI